jgi:hypothetical protein
MRGIRILLTLAALLSSACTKIYDLAAPKTDSVPTTPSVTLMYVGQSASVISAGDIVAGSAAFCVTHGANLDYTVSTSSQGLAILEWSKTSYGANIDTGCQDKDMVQASFIGRGVWDGDVTVTAKLTSLADKSSAAATFKVTVSSKG